uniref:Putative ovule protein n=1 Tax=Solanum chacoense TaxID=4108 RepID=A0A0V0GL96_SOLCH
MKFPASLNFEFAGWLFDLALITEIQSSPLPTGQNPESARLKSCWEHSPIQSHVTSELKIHVRNLWTKERVI